MEFKNKYIIVSPAVADVINNGFIVDPERVRYSIDGSKYVAEISPESPYYNLSFAKSHTETLQIMNTADWIEPNADIDL